MRTGCTVYHSAIDVPLCRTRDGQFFITGFANATLFAATLCVPYAPLMHDSSYYFAGRPLTESRWERNAAISLSECQPSSLHLNLLEYSRRLGQFLVANLTCYKAVATPRPFFIRGEYKKEKLLVDWPNNSSNLRNCVLQECQSTRHMTQDSNIAMYSATCSPIIFRKPEVIFSIQSHPLIINKQSVIWLLFGIFTRWSGF